MKDLIGNTLEANHVREQKEKLELDLQVQTQRHNQGRDNLVVANVVTLKVDPWPTHYSRIIVSVPTLYTVSEGELIFTELASGGQGLGMRLRQGQPHAEERNKVSINDVSYSTTVCL